MVGQHRGSGPKYDSHTGTIQRPQETSGPWAGERRNQRLLFCWVCGKVGVRGAGCCQRAGNGQRSQLQRG